MPNPFRYFNSSPEVIRLAVMMYIRYPLSLRQGEDLLFERGIDICHETIRCCQSNANQSPNHRTPVLSGRKLTPLGQGCRAVLLEDVTAIEVAVEIEVIMDRGMDGSELLQGLYVSEFCHCSLSSPEWLV